jgi:hypothetical protein
MMGGVDLTAILLGVGFCARFNYARTDKVDEIIAAVDEIVRATDDTPRTPKPSDN